MREGGRKEGRRKEATCRRPLTPSLRPPEHSKDQDARFLVVRDAGDQNLAGFVHFRFIIEGLDVVLYIYEIQLAPGYRRRGLGAHLMQTLENVGRETGMKWIMLTCFRENFHAYSFYTRKMECELGGRSGR